MKLSDYKKFISKAFTSNTRQGFADWRNCGKLFMDVTEKLETAGNDLCAEGRYADLFTLSNWTYVKWSKTEKDDSNGETREFCACVYGIWETIYTDGEAYLSHDVMLETMIKLLDGGNLEDVEDEIYDFILKHFKTDEHLKRKEQFLLRVMDDLKRQIPENEVLKYSLYVKEQYYVRVLADQKRPIQEIRDFLKTRDSYTNIELLAEIEKEYGNYEEAIVLYKSQIEDRPGSYWSDAPRKALMEIYLLQGNKEAYNAVLYKMMCAHTDNAKYYQEYKALFTEAEWKAEWDKLLEKYKDKLAAINLWLSLENRYDLIMDNVEPDNDYVLDIYGMQLFKLYSDRCLKVLACAADRQAQRANNRQNYRTIVQTLKKIASHPGGKELAAELAAKYRAQYPRRTAMLDELKMF